MRHQRLEVDAPRAVWRSSSDNPGPRPAVTRDGQRALVAMPVDNDVARPLEVVVNWTRRIRER